MHFTNASPSQQSPTPIEKNPPTKKPTEIRNILIFPRTNKKNIKYHFRPASSAIFQRNRVAPTSLARHPKRHKNTHTQNVQAACFPEEIQENCLVCNNQTVVGFSAPRPLSRRAFPAREKRRGRGDCKTHLALPKPSPFRL